MSVTHETNAGRLAAALQAAEDQIIRSLWADPMRDDRDNLEAALEALRRVLGQQRKEYRQQTGDDEQEDGDMLLPHLQEIRELAGLTQNDVAMAATTSLLFIRQVEMGCDADVDPAIRVADSLNVTLAELAGE